MHFIYEPEYEIEYLEVIPGYRTSDKCNGMCS